MVRSFYPPLLNLTESMFMRCQILRKSITAMLTLCLVACASNAKISKSIKDPEYRGRISNVAVVLDVTHYQDALMHDNLGKDALGELGVRYESLRMLIGAVDLKLKEKLSAVRVKYSFYAANDSFKDLDSLMMSSDKSKTTKAIMSNVVTSNISREILFIDFPGYQVYSTNSEKPRWYGNVTLRVKLFERDKGESGMPKVVWVAETNPFSLSPSECMRDQYSTCASNIASAIVDQLVVDGLLNQSE